MTIKSNKRAKITIFLIVCFFLASHSQSTFEKKYNIFQNYIIPTSDNGFIVTGSLNKNLIVLKTNKRGDFTWSKEYVNGVQDVGQCIKQTKDKGYIVTGFTKPEEFNSNVLLMKLDKNGECLWSRSFGDKQSFDIGQTVELTMDKGYIISANTGMGQKNIYIIKTDSSGTLSWAKSYKISNSDYCYSIKETPDGSYIIGGIADLSFSYYYRGFPLIIKIDKQGNLLWKKILKIKNATNKDLKGAIKDIAFDSQNNILAAGFVSDIDCKEMKGLAVKLNSNGDIVDYRTYNNSQCHNVCLNSLDNAIQGGFVAVGGGFTPGFCMSLNVLKIKENLELDWGWSYKNLIISCGGNWEQVIKSTLDGGYIIGGRTLLKLNSNGKISCSTPVGLTCLKDITISEEKIKSKETAINYAYYTIIPKTAVKSINIQRNTYCEDTCTRCLSKLDFIISDTVICVGQPINFSASSSLSDELIKWNWRFQGANINSSNVQNPQNIKFIHTGQYMISLNVKAGKFDTTIVRKVKVSGVDLQLKNMTLCEGIEAYLDAGNPGALYRWNTGETTRKINVKTPGIYSVTVSDRACVIADTSIVTKSQKPQITLPDYTIICNGEDISLNSGGGYFNYLWSTGETTTSIFVYEQGKYSVVAYNDCGKITDSTIVILSDTCNDAVKIPNIFSPNNDGTNDFFVIKVNDYNDYKLIIYNHLGKQIYENKNPGVFWDGKINQKTAPEGTYYYILYLKEKNKDKEYRGSMMLVR